MNLYNESNFSQDGTCQYDKSKVVGTCTGHSDIPTGNEVALATAVATVGPISVAIDASQFSFQLYKYIVIDIKII